MMVVGTGNESSEGGEGNERDPGILS